MKLIKFRVYNYKSIKDSEYCWLTSDITILAGKNESGKSGILQAINDFNLDIENISYEAHPLEIDETPIIELVFGLDRKEIDNVAQENNIVINKDTYNFILEHGVSILKYSNGEYDLGDEDLQTLLNEPGNQRNLEIRLKIEELIKKIRQTENIEDLFDLAFPDDLNQFQNSIIKITNLITERSLLIIDEEKKIEINTVIETINNYIKELKEPKIAETFLDDLLPFLPKFILFKEELDILPFEILLVESKNNRAITDFAKVARLDLDKVINTNDPQQRRNILKRHSASITGDFMDYWEQNELELIAEADGDKLHIGIQEAEKTALFKPEQRSRGFQWFLSFYLRLNSEKNKENIILIDEPGLFLHAKAQKDVLKVFEEISKESQIIFSTHSPYLIDTQRLDRVRLVIKDKEKGTEIENKIHKNSDTETLTPIITAIGLDLSHNFSIAGKNNVLLEGISDYYFLQSIIKILKNNLYDTINMIPCIGASKIPQIVSLLLGWGLKFVTLLDNDLEGKKTAKQLSEKLMIEKNKIIMISDIEGFSIEDLFSQSDFLEFVIEEQFKKEEYPGNSKLLKDRQIDKALLSKKFFEKVSLPESNIKLSSDTIQNFKNIFEKIIRELEIKAE